MKKPLFISKDNNFTLYIGDNTKIISKIGSNVDMVFADPPYFLSNNGQTIENGKIVSVNKGEWDKPIENMDKFNLKWIKATKKVMKPNATIWISGTVHNIFSVQKALIKLGFKILNIITWAKTNPPPNFSRRCFTHSTEYVIWARKEEKTAHYYNYDLMRKLNEGKQMKDVWQLPAIAKYEKSCGKHPTQKPLSLLSRIILASTKENALCLDPFTGSSTTGIAANIFNRRFIGIDLNSDFLDIGIKRKEELTNKGSKFFLKKIYGIRQFSETVLFTT